MERKALIIAGMHRSGTSALTRVINLMGADLPRDLILPGTDNPLGFWESKEIVAINEEILQSAGTSWHDFSEFPSGWFDSPVARSFRSKALSLVQRDFLSSVLFVLKDPRICRIIPFWVASLEEFHSESNFVHIVRNPLEIAASLKARNGFHPSKSLLLWLRHVIDSERDSRGRKRSFVSYEGLLEDWRTCVEKISKELEISWPRLPYLSDAQVEDFLCWSARHQQVAPGELENRGGVARWVKLAYSVTAAAARDGKHGGAFSEVSEVLDSIRRELDDADLAFGPILAADKLNLERQTALVVQLTSDLTTQKRTLESLEQTVLTLGSDLAAEKETAQVCQSRIEVLSLELSAGQQSLEEREQAIAALTSELEVHREAVREREERIEGLSSELAAERVDSEERAVRIRDLSEELSSGRARLTEAEQRVAALVTELASEKQSVQERYRELERLSAALAAEQGKVGELRKDLSAERAKSEELRQRISWLRNTVSQMWTMLAERDVQISNLKQHIQEMALSTSWKLTRPLRASKRFLRTMTNARNVRSYLTIRRAGKFDSHYYLQANPDVALIGVNPLLHYLDCGDREGRRPNPAFDPAHYRSAYPDVVAAGVNSLVHYIRFGEKEGRSPLAPTATQVR